MGYYKSTLSYNQPEFNEPSPHEDYDFNFDCADCFICRKVAPNGYVWIDGLCPDCKALGQEHIEEQ